MQSRSGRYYQSERRKLFLAQKQPNSKRRKIFSMHCHWCGLHHPSEEREDCKNKRLDLMKGKYYRCEGNCENTVWLEREPFRQHLLKSNECVGVGKFCKDWQTELELDLFRFRAKKQNNNWILSRFDPRVKQHLYEELLERLSGIDNDSEIKQPVQVTSARLQEDDSDAIDEHDEDETREDEESRDQLSEGDDKCDMVQYYSAWDFPNLEAYSPWQKILFGPELKLNNQWNPDVLPLQMLLSGTQDLLLVLECGKILDLFWNQAFWKRKEVSSQKRFDRAVEMCINTFFCRVTGQRTSGASGDWKSALEELEEHFFSRNEIGFRHPSKKLIGMTIAEGGKREIKKMKSQLPSRFLQCASERMKVNQKTLYQLYLLREARSFILQSERQICLFNFFRSGVSKKVIADSYQQQHALSTERYYNMWKSVSTTDEESGGRSISDCRKEIFKLFKCDLKDLPWENSTSKYLAIKRDRQGGFSPDQAQFNGAETVVDWAGLNDRQLGCVLTYISLIEFRCGKFKDTTEKISIKEVRSKVSNTRVAKILGDLLKRAHSLYSSGPCSKDCDGLCSESCSVLINCNGWDERFFSSSRGMHKVDLYHRIFVWLEFYFKANPNLDRIVSCPVIMKKCPKKKRKLQLPSRSPGDSGDDCNDGDEPEFLFFHDGLE